MRSRTLCGHEGDVSTMAERIPSGARTLLDGLGAWSNYCSPREVNHRLESPMREIRPYGSEGGAASENLVVPTPYQDTPLACLYRTRDCAP